MSLSGLIIDVFLALVAVTQVITYTKRGFIKSLLFFLQAIACFALAIIFAPALGKIISSNFSVSQALSKILSYVVIFIISFVISNVLIYFIDKSFENHAFNKINKTLGFVLGLVFAFVKLVIICSVITGALSILQFINPDISVENVRQSTIIYRLISNLDIINLLYNIHNWYRKGR